MSQNVSDRSGIIHAVIAERMGATVTYACGGWNYWVHLKRVNSSPTCEGCILSNRQIAERGWTDTRAEREAQLRERKSR